MPPQICIHGQLDTAEQQVLDALGSLPDEAIVYAQPKLVHRSEVRYPDFVIVYHEWGVIVLEVKGWYDITDRDRRSVWLRGRSEPKSSPVEQARGAVHVLENMLKRDPDLIGYAGTLDFYYAYGGALPFLPDSTISWLEEAWGENYLLGKQDLGPDRLPRKLAFIDGFSQRRCRMTENQVRAVCAIIDPKNKAKNHETGDFKGVYDRTQEKLAKERLPERRESETKQDQVVQATLDPDLAPAPQTRMRHLEEGMPDEARQLGSATHVRLVRGFAGTGKTDVLILRAYYLYEQYPDLDILVTTFNHPLWEERLLPELKQLQPRLDVIKFDTLCAQIYRKKYGCWNTPQDTGGLLSSMVADYPLIEELGPKFLSDEFIWMKETGRTTRARYVKGVRHGRGAVSGRTLGVPMKNQIFDLFEAYENRLREMPAFDWVDLHDKTLQYLEQGLEPDRRYDVILIDEAQHFAPTWMRIVDHFLKPEGSLFICDDPSQSVYRYYSWRQKGVDVVGRTRWLRVPYRNTRQIFAAAYAVIQSNSLAQRLLADSGESAIPDLDHADLRDGPLPEVHFFPTVKLQQDFVVSEIGRLVKDGVIPSEIGILHEEKYVLDSYRSRVPSGIQLYELKRQTGLEYKAVFLPQVQELFERAVGVSWEDYKAKNLLKSYMAMTRARDHLYLLYCQQWPQLLEPIRPYVKWVEH